MTVSEDHAEMSQVWWSRVALIVCLLELAAESLLFCPLRLVGLWTAFSGTSPRTVSLSVASSLTSSSSLVLRSAEKGVGSCYSSSHLRPAALLLWRSGLVALSAENSGKFSSFSGRITNRFKYCSNYWRGRLCAVLSQYRYLASEQPRSNFAEIFRAPESRAVLYLL